MYCNGDVFINPRLQNRALDNLSAIKRSGERYRIHAPIAMDSLTFKLGDNEAKECVVDPGTWNWTVYFPPETFPTIGTFVYEIGGTDDRGNAVVFGRGKLTVYA